MINLAHYRELTKDETHPSLKDHLEQAEYPNQAVILYYLKHERFLEFEAPGARFDPLSPGVQVGKTLALYNDKDYCWTSDIVFLVERYNLRLPKEFERHVIGKFVPE